MSNSRFAQHKPYFNKDGKRVPGTTTISGILDKSRFLVPWANKLGLQGIESSKYVDEKAKAGTYAHALILHHLKNEAAPPDPKEFTGHEIEQAENSFLKYLEWEKRHVVEALLCEEPFVSEEHQFGGTIDFYGLVDHRLTLLDFKTSKDIYEEHWLQVGGGYGILLQENERPFEEVRILQIGRDETEGFNEQYRASDDMTILAARDIFILCRKIYELQKNLRKGV